MSKETVRHLFLPSAPPPKKGEPGSEEACWNALKKLYESGGVILVLLDGMEPPLKEPVKILRFVFALEEAARLLGAES